MRREGRIQAPSATPGCCGAPAQPGDRGMVPTLPWQGEPGWQKPPHFFSKFTELWPNEPEGAIKRSLRANSELAAEWGRGNCSRFGDKLLPASLPRSGIDLVSELMTRINPV